MRSFKYYKCLVDFSLLSTIKTFKFIYATFEHYLRLFERIYITNCLITSCIDRIINTILSNKFLLFGHYIVCTNIFSSLFVRKNPCTDWTAYHLWMQHSNGFIQISPKDEIVSFVPNPFWEGHYYWDAIWTTFFGPKMKFLFFFNNKFVPKDYFCRIELWPNFLIGMHQYYLRFMLIHKLDVPNEGTINFQFFIILSSYLTGTACSTYINRY